MLNPIDEARFAEFRDKCRELKVPAPPEIFIGLQVHDRSGVLVFDDKQRGHSWTRNFYNAAFAMMATSPGGGSNNFGAGYLSMKTTGGTVRYNASHLASTYGYMGVGFHNTAANANYGILVGTGDTAFSINQYALAAIIAHGNGSGQFAHAVMATPTVSYTSNPKTWKNTIVRLFNNNSGDSVTVKETGLVWYGLGMNTTQEYSLFERSVLDPTVAVANGAQLTVTYEISMDFSAID